MIRVTVIAAGVFALLGFWGCAGFDAAYMTRVMVRQDSGTEDHHWKRTSPIAEAETPSSLDEHIDTSRVKAAFGAAESGGSLGAYLAGSKTLAFLVYLDGTLIHEWYGASMTKDQPAAAFSISKSVLSLLIAREIAAGRIAGWDAPITDFVPELAQRDPRFMDITLDDLADMRSGIAFSQATRFPFVNQDQPAVYYASDLAASVVRRVRITSPPGVFTYNDYAPNLNGLALQAASGSSLADGPMQAFWREIGAEFPAAWTVDQEGFAWHESGLVVTGRDLVRIGRLLLNEGRVDGRGVIPPDYLPRVLEDDGRGLATRFGDHDMGYRQGWWVRARASGPDDILAMGAHGQVMLVSPANRVVIVRLAQDGQSEPNIVIAERLRRLADVLGAASPE